VVQDGTASLLKNGKATLLWYRMVQQPGSEFKIILVGIVRLNVDFGGNKPLSGEVMQLWWHELSIVKGSLAAALWWRMVQQLVGTG
jgi:hypothetical protein